MVPNNDNATTINPPRNIPKNAPNILSKLPPPDFSIISFNDNTIIFDNKIAINKTNKEPKIVRSSGDKYSGNIAEK